MNNPTIVIAHKIKNRIRFKLSHPLHNDSVFLNEFMKREEIIDFKYNKISKSIIIKYKSELIREDEIILRVIIMYSKDYDLIPIRLVYNSNRKGMPPMAYYSLLTLFIGGVSKLIPINKKISEFINWAIVGTTLGAIGEHAYREINEKGYFDPEVVSAMYLVNSVGKGKFLMPSIITWIATFGRHIVDMSYGRILIEVKEFKNKCSKETYYDISVIPDIDTSKKVSIFKVFLEKFVETEERTINKSLLISNNDIRKYEGQIFDGFDCGPTFISMNKNSGKIYKNVLD